MVSLHNCSRNEGRIFGLNEQKMFFLLHEYLITDLNAEKKTKSTVKKM